MKILFVCQYNRYRSRVAEALFNYHNKDKRAESMSAGTRVTEPGKGIISVAVRVLKKMNISYNAEHGAVQITKDMVDEADKIVIVADEVDEGRFPRDKTIKIGFPDAYSSDEETLENVKGIEKAILELIREIE